jgi:toxin YhaV
MRRWKMTEIRVLGWTIYFDGLFFAQYKELMGAADKARAADPIHYESKRAVKLFAATRRLIFEEIPKDPSDPRFRQSNTLGEDYRHWFRAKYFQQYRIFFRLNEKEKIIIFAWMNDDGTKRAYDSRTDAYRVFRKMLERGRPSDDWVTLLKEAKQTPSKIEGDL